MFSFFKRDPVKKLIAQQDIKLEQAMMAQRNGDIKSYSQLTLEADLIEKKIIALQAKSVS